jgi:hypothetical protein
MRTGRRPGWGRLGLLLGISLAAPQGCSVLRHTWIYGTDRAKDASDMADLGLTVSWKRGFSAYACGVGLVTLGYGCVDGWFIGVGGSHFGFVRHYHKTIGLLLLSYEEYGWGKFDRQDPDTLTRRYLGILGWLFFPKYRRNFGPA